jgi:hypothetical protein
MKNLNSALLRKFLKLASEELEGQWLLVGGTLLPAVGIDIRSTIDIDLIGLGSKEKNQNLELMSLAEKLGLSIEVINQAAEFFVAKKKPTQGDMIELITGPKATIYRPTVELYWSLKIHRLTEADSLDCQYYLQYCKGQKDKINFKSMMAVISKELQIENSEAKFKRLSALKELLSSAY